MDGHHLCLIVNSIIGDKHWLRAIITLLAANRYECKSNYIQFKKEISIDFVK